MKEIPLTQGKVTIVDDEDYPEISKYKWFAHKRAKNFYAERAVNRQMVRMHRVILITPVGMDTDHINGDTLDNRRANLRAVTHRENCQNRHQIKTSKHPGVSWYSDYKKWRAVIQISGAFKHLGYFDREEDASKAYKDACNRLTESIRPIKEVA